MTSSDKPLLFTKKEYLDHSPIFTNTVDCPNLYNPNCTLSDLHLHDFIEFSVVVSGNGIHKIWNKTYECKKGDVFILNEGVPHCYFAISEKEFPTVLNVLFDERLLNSNDQSSFCYGIFNENSSFAYKKLTLEQLKKVTTIGDFIKEELENRQSFWQESASASLTNLLVFFSREVNEKVENEIWDSEVENPLVKTAIKSILENYSKQDFTLGSLSKSLFVSKSHLSKLLYKACGEHFSNYLRSLRIKRSAYLLKNTNLSNQQIVDACGFKDLPTFYKNFKNAYHISPKQYRIGKDENKEI